MTLQQAIDVVYEEAKHQGEPLTRDVCEAIVVKLFDLSSLDVTLKPGDIAKLYRRRYDRPRRDPRDQ